MTEHDRKQALADAMRPAMRGLGETILALRALGLDGFATALTYMRDAVARQAFGIGRRL